MVSENKNSEEPKTVMVKVSFCHKCNGWVRSAVMHRMSKQSKKEFAIEAFEYNLTIREMTIDEHSEMINSDNNKTCKC